MSNKLMTHVVEREWKGSIRQMWIISEPVRCAIGEGSRWPIPHQRRPVVPFCIKVAYVAPVKSAYTCDASFMYSHTTTIIHRNSFLFLQKRRTHVADWNLSSDEICLHSFQSVLLGASASRCALFHA